jgi:predicted nucleotidyltransferase
MIQNWATFLEKNINLPSADDIINASDIHSSRVKCIYIFGSRVYGTATNDSDWDIIMVANNSVEEVEKIVGNFNIHIITPDKFKKDLEWHNIRNIECVMAPDWAKIKEDIDWDFKINLIKLRHSISHISSNSWVKSKKKLQAGEYYIGIKSMFHSLRIPMFGAQLASEGKITNWSCANSIWSELVSKTWTWDELNTNYRERYNNLMTEFRKLASKF